MREYSLTRDAHADLVELWTYIGEDSINQADLLLVRLEHKFADLAENPGMGRPRPDIAAGLRSAPVGAYVVIYSETVTGVLIVRVLHGMRDIPPLFS